jgi:TatD DNase family protein
MVQGKKGRELVQRMPKNRVLLETDGPFSSRNGKSLNPWEAVDSVKYLSETWSINAAETKEQLMKNFKELLT